MKPQLEAVLDQEDGLIIFFYEICLPFKSFQFFLNSVSGSSVKEDVVHLKSPEFEYLCVQDVYILSND